MLRNFLEFLAFVWPIVGVSLALLGYIEVWAAVVGFITWAILIQLGEDRHGR